MFVAWRRQKSKKLYSQITCRVKTKLGGGYQNAHPVVLLVKNAFLLLWIFSLPFLKAVTEIYRKFPSFQGNTANINTCSPPTGRSRRCHLGRTGRKPCPRLHPRLQSHRWPTAANKKNKARTDVVRTECDHQRHEGK